MFCGMTPPPNNRPYSHGKGVVKFVQIWHLYIHDKHDSNDLSTHKIPNLFCYIKLRGMRWTLNGGYVILSHSCGSSTHHVGRGIFMLKREWMISVAKYVYLRIKVFHPWCVGVSLQICLPNFAENQSSGDILFKSSSNDNLISKSFFDKYEYLLPYLLPWQLYKI